MLPRDHDGSVVVAVVAAAVVDVYCYYNDDGGDDFGGVVGVGECGVDDAGSFVSRIVVCSRVRLAFAMANMTSRGSRTSRVEDDDVQLPFFLFFFYLNTINRINKENNI